MEKGRTDDVDDGDSVDRICMPATRPKQRRHRSQLSRGTTAQRAAGARACLRAMGCRAWSQTIYEYRMMMIIITNARRVAVCCVSANAASQPNRPTEKRRGVCMVCAAWRVPKAPQTRSRQHHHTYTHNNNKTIISPEDAAAERGLTPKTRNPHTANYTTDNTPYTSSSLYFIYIYSVELACV